jgi:hypothetical protein
MWGDAPGDAVAAGEAVAADPGGKEVSVGSRCLAVAGFFV